MDPDTSGLRDRRRRKLGKGRTNINWSFVPVDPELNPRAAAGRMRKHARRQSRRKRNHRLGP
jgi:hypothetical protein